MFQLKDIDMNIIFDQLRVSEDGKYLYIDAHVNTASYFEKTYIDSIVIMTADQVSETSPKMPTENYIYKKTIEGEEKEISLALTPADFIKMWETDTSAMSFKQTDMNKTLFFVYVSWKGSVDGCAPCGSDDEFALGITFNESILHQRVMDFTKELVSNCDVPYGFMDFILLWYAFKASVETGHYISAIKFFNMLFDIVDDRGYSFAIGGCGCHG